MKCTLALISLAGIFAMPANALDGTRSPANTPSEIGIRPGNTPNTEFTRQPQRAAQDLLAQANPSGATLKEQLVGAWAHVSCTVRAFPWCSSPNNGIHILDSSGHYATV